MIQNNFYVDGRDMTLDEVKAALQKEETAIEANPDFYKGIANNFYSTEVYTRQIIGQEIHLTV